MDDSEKTTEKLKGAGLSGGGAAASARLLIVEDDPLVAQSLRHNLECLGYPVSGIVSSGEEAVQQTAETRPDLVLMDVWLNGEMDGIEAAAQIRERFDTPVVYLTAHSDDKNLQRAKVTEPFGYILKPFGIEELHSTLEMALYRHAMERRVRESERRYRIVSELSSDYAYAAQVGADGTLRNEWVTEAYARITGYAPKEMSQGSGLTSHVHPDDLTTVQEHIQRLLSGRPEVSEYRIVTHSGDVRWLRDFARPEWDEAQERVVRLYGAVQDVTERKKVEEELHIAHAELEERVAERTAELSRVNRLLVKEIGQRQRTEDELRCANRQLTLLIQCSQAVMRASNESELLSRVCELVIEEGGYRLAWVGYAQLDGDKTVRPVAHAGYEEGYLDTLQITWDDSERGRGPTGTAIRRGQPALSRNILEDFLFASWREEASKRGYVSSIALPLIAAGACLGALTIYSGEPDAFDAGETELLLQLANDLASGIAALRVRDKRQRAEEALRQRVEELSSMHNLGRRLSACLSLDQMVQAVLDEMLSVFAADLALLFLREGDELSFRGMASREERAACLEVPLHRVGECLCGLAVREGKPIYSNDVYADPRCTWEECRQAGMRSFAALPLRSRDAVVGVLGLGSTRSAAFEQRMAFLETIADQVAVALENVRLNQEAAEIQVLREVDRLRSELIGNVSHELRTPLGLIKILASTLLRKDVIFDRETQLDLLRDIDDEADKLGRIVDNLLGASRIERGRLRLARQYEDLGELMSEVLQAIAIQYPQHRFVQEFPVEPLLAPVDVLSLEQVMRNLLDNAAKYSAEGSTVAIRGGVAQGQALIQVVDEGPGIPDEAIERVFERFYRVDNEITRRTRGIGLGLSVCREIIESHGGLIWVESAPGEGSTFSFTLPLDVRGDGLDELVAMRA